MKKITPESIKEMHVRSGIICKYCIFFEKRYWNGFSHGYFTYCGMNPLGRGREENEYCNLFVWRKKDDTSTGV